MDADASQKMVRFVDLCDTFHLPVVNFVDNPGFEIGIEAEKRGTIRHGVRALFAVYQASVPWCSILVRRVFGVAGAGHGAHHRLNLRYAWPRAEWGSLPIEGGVEAAYRRQIEAAPDPDALRAGARGEARIAALAAAAPPRPSASRRSSTRATRGRCSSSGPGARTNCCRARWDRRRAGCERDQSLRAGGIAVKPALIVLWIACFVSLFLPESSLVVWGQRLFWGLLIVHAIECVVFLPKLRAAGGSLGHHLVQTMLFGILHARNLGDGPPPSASA